MAEALRYRSKAPLALFKVSRLKLIAKKKESLNGHQPDSQVLFRVFVLSPAPEENFTHYIGRLQHFLQGDYRNSDKLIIQGRNYRTGVFS